MTAASVAAGDLVIVAVKWENADTTVTVSDGTSSLTETPAGHAADASPAWTTAFYLLSSVATGTVTYTVTWSAAQTFRDIGVMVYRPPSTPVTDGTFVKAVGNSTAFASGNITTTGTDGVAFGYYGETGGTASAQQINGSAASQVLTFGVQPRSSIWSLTYTAGFTGQATATISPSGTWGGGLMAFKASGAAAAPPARSLIGVGKG
jgi:hypothetical protein